MSVELLTQAFRVQGIPSSGKFILVAIADAANDLGECWPSAKHIQSKTGLNRKTILSWIAKFIETGILTDTGKRVGLTAQVRVLRFELNDTVFGTVPVLPSKSTVFGTRNPKGTNQYIYLGESLKKTRHTPTEKEQMFEGGVS
jgi:pyocin large subunit-like protein